MVKVEFLGPIGKGAAEFDVKNLSELGAILREDAALKEWLGKSAVSVNGEIVRDPNAPLKDGDQVSILPPVCGG
ncbi:MAG: MoaD/ThiS family protein [Helicobacteraceae bacterium]|jgi:molybdopterin synthase sulfur carrier subunit|nr:MoaD/ThiS family protein [Helicobacteraceae bacterium]